MFDASIDVAVVQLSCQLGKSKLHQDSFYVNYKSRHLLNIINLQDICKNSESISTYEDTQTIWSWLLLQSQYCLKLLRRFYCHYQLVPLFNFFTSVVFQSLHILMATFQQSGLNKKSQSMEKFYSGCTNLPSLPTTRYNSNNGSRNSGSVLALYFLDAPSHLYKRVCQKRRGVTC